MEGKRILLVEDNPDDQILTMRALEKHHIANQVIVVQDGAEALEVLSRLADEGAMPGVVLLDLKLPKVDGLQVLRQIRSDDRTKLLPVVILTTSREEQDVIESYRLGANSYIRKPVDFTQFADAVQRLGMYWLLLNEPCPG